jgi:hypothetical protein
VSPRWLRALSVRRRTALDGSCGVRLAR